MECAILLIEIDDKGKCNLNKDALSIIETIEQPISAICVAGPYRTGKSFLLNRLIGRQDGFKIGPTVQACTKGIWMWNKPIKTNDGYTILLDTEGLGSFNRDIQIDTKIFTIAMLFSSFFIYNTLNSIDEKALDTLSLVVNLSKYIHVKAKNPNMTEDLSEFSQLFPYFLWVIRDFSLKLLTTDRQYLENALRPAEEVDENAQKKNEIRASITNYFKERDCITLVRPLGDETELREIDYVKYEKLRQPFREKVEQLITKVYTRCRPKSINGIPLIGRMYAQMISKYIEQINSDSVPTIMTTWDQIVESEVSTLYTNAIKVFEDGFSKIVQELPMEEAFLRGALYNLKEATIKSFSSTEVQGNAAYHTYMQKHSNENN